MELSINNVTKQFKVKKAVDDISFSMKNGVYGLLGVNGAGKTTLMRMLCTLTTPDCGMITWDGKDGSFVSPDSWISATGFWVLSISDNL
mgnify:CR=1 FL=1